MTEALFDEALEFFQELEHSNTKEWWLAERHRYDREIRPTFVAVCERIESFGAFRIYRPHNDVRFQQAKGPYKTFIGGVAERSDGVGIFVQVSSKGLLIGTGIPQPATDQLPRLREAIAADVSGEQFRAAVDHCERLGVRVHGGRWPPLARPPRGFPTDHPRADWLRWKGVETNRRVARPPWRDVRTAAAAVAELVALAEPIHSWLGAHVGPSALTAEERYAPKSRRS